jgi:hypothetical protein
MLTAGPRPVRWPALHVIIAISSGAK